MPAIKAGQGEASRSDIAAEVEKLIEAAVILESRLGMHSPAGVLIAGGGPGPAMEDDNEILKLLPDLKHRANRTLDRLKKAGRGKVSAGNTPEEICATILAVSWHMVTGKFPAHSADAPCQAAEMVWLMAKGPSSTYKYAESSTKRWRPHLRKALSGDPRLELLRGFIWAKLRPEAG